MYKNELTKNAGGFSQEQQFVCSPLTGHTYLIYIDGTLYRHLFLQKPKDKKDFFDRFPILKGMNHRSWREFHMKLQQLAYDCYTWILPYNCQEKNVNFEGFNMGDPLTKSDIDVSLIYRSLKEGWNNQLWARLQKPVRIPKEAMHILQSSNKNGFVFIRSMNERLNPLSISIPTMLVPLHLVQGNCSLSK